MDEIISDYSLHFDEINALVAYSFVKITDRDYVKSIIDDILSLLIEAYVLGINHTATMLDYEIPVNSGDMYDAIYFIIEGKNFEDRVIEHLSKDDLTALQTLVETEYHRIYNAAVLDGAAYYNHETGTDVLKTWVTVGDERVRDTHSYLEGQSVLLDELFFTYDGDSAPYPGGFRKAQNNVNCRCIIILSTNII